MPRKRPELPTDNEAVKSSTVIRGRFSLFPYATVARYVNNRTTFTIAYEPDVELPWILTKLPKEMK